MRHPRCQWYLMSAFTLVILLLLRCGHLAIIPAFYLLLFYATVAIISPPVFQWYITGLYQAGPIVQSHFLILSSLSCL